MKTVRSVLAVAFVMTLLITNRAQAQNAAVVEATPQPPTPKAASTPAPAPAAVPSAVPAAAPQPPLGQYQVIPESPGVRGQLWIADGPQYLESENQTAGNRFRFGGDAQFGDQYRFDLGLTLMDIISSGETAQSVGDVSRWGFGPNVGYFIVPDRFYVIYTFDIQSVQGSRVSGSVTSYGHQVALGYRFPSESNASWTLEATYLNSPPVTVTVFDVNLNQFVDAIYPNAQIFGLNLKFGIDLWQ